jgi:hypothetical protein
MDEKPRYIVVYGSDISGVIYEVNQKINQGYIPQGGIGFDHVFSWYMQAMVLSNKNYHNWKTLEE